MKKYPPVFKKEKGKWTINLEFLWYNYTTHGMPSEITVDTIVKTYKKLYGKNIDNIRTGS